MEAREGPKLNTATSVEEEMTAALLELYPEAKDYGVERVADSSITQNWGDKTILITSAPPSKRAWPSWPRCRRPIWSCSSDPLDLHACASYIPFNESRKELKDEA